VQHTRESWADKATFTTVNIYPQTFFFSFIFFPFLECSEFFCCLFCFVVGHKASRDKTTFKCVALSLSRFKQRSMGVEYPRCLASWGWVGGEEKKKKEKKKEKKKKKKEKKKEWV